MVRSTSPVKSYEFEVNSNDAVVSGILVMVPGDALSEIIVHLGADVVELN